MGAGKSRPILQHLPASSESTAPFSTNSIKKTSPVLRITMSEKPYKHALGSIELLKSTNYAKWNRNCHRILEGIHAWNIITGKEVEPNAPVGFNAAAIAERIRKKNLRPDAQAVSGRTRHLGRCGRTLAGHIPLPTRNAQAM